MIAVATSDIVLCEKARALAAYLHVNFIGLLADKNEKDHSYLLLLTPSYLGIYKARDKKIKPFYIDFLSGKMRYRIQHASLHRELLARAMGLRPQDSPIILDATAGLGQDSFVLASLGFHIIMLERSPILFVLLADALERAKQNKIMVPIIGRMTLKQGDSLAWLQNLPQQSRPDIIYLDPMFPKRQKSAASKKEMAILQDLLEKNENEILLLKMALTCAKCRVVVKRPRLAAPIGGYQPNFSLIGKSSRFDIYLT